jgi:adenylosuccinate synthase
LLLSIVTEGAALRSPVKGQHTMSNVVIVGTQWGDEGKGKIVDLLTSGADVIVRFQGGPNAGHTVVVGERQTILHQVPSGILHPGKQCIIGNGVVIDLETLLNEIDQVKSQGYFENDSALIISQNAHLIMPYHKQIDLAREHKKGKNKIGTTGRGIGPAYEDKAARTGIRVVDIFNDDTFRSKLEENLAEKNFYLQNYLQQSPCSAAEIIQRFGTLRERIRCYIGDSSTVLNTMLSEGKKILFEGAQGSLLDIDHGTYPFVTSSNTAAAQASLGSGIGPRHLNVIAGIAKAYSTRVGSGPFPTEQEGEVGDYLRKVGGEFGATTGRPRRCGWFDLVTVRHASRINSITHLIITKLDVLSGMDRIRVCTGYAFKDTMVQNFPSDLGILEQCRPVYDELPGWPEDISGVRSFEGLPGRAQQYIRYLEDMTGIPVSMVSVGTRRSQIITLRDPFDA